MHLPSLLRTQAFCLGTAAIYTAPKIEGPWTFSGNLFNQMAINGKVGAAGGTFLLANTSTHIRNTDIRLVSLRS